MPAFEKFYKIGQQSRRDPEKTIVANQGFSTEENQILQQILNNYASTVGHRLSQEEVTAMVSGFTSGISYLGRSGAKVFWGQSSRIILPK